MWRVEDGQQLLTAAKPPFPALFVAASSASSSHSLSQSHSLLLLLLLLLPLLLLLLFNGFCGFYRAFV
jgi:hypothetical protein